MQETPNFFIIEADPLTIPSKKPSFLEERMKSRINQNRTNLVEKNRQDLILSRKLKLREWNKKANQLALMNKIKNNERCQAIRKKLDKRFLEAKTIRDSQLETQVLGYSKTVKRAKLIAKKYKTSETKKANFPGARKRSFKLIPSFISCDINCFFYEKEALNTIISWWKSRNITLVIKGIKLLGLSSKNTQLAQYNNVVSLITNKDLISKVKLLFLKIKKNYKLGDFKNEFELNKISKIFLTSFLITLHPDQVIGNEQIDKDLYESAKRVYWMYFLSDCCHFKVFETIIFDFYHSFEIFHMKFTNWKKKDCNDLLDSMSNFYVKLENLKAEIITIGNHQSPEIQQEFITNIDNKKKEIYQQILSLSKSHGAKKIYSFFENNLEKIENQKVSTNISENIKIKNLKIVHSVLLDKNFVLKLDKKSLTKDIESLDALTKDIHSSSTSSNSLTLLLFVKNIKKRILNLCENKDLIEFINNKLDDNLITNSISNNKFNIQDYLNKLIECLKMMCSPVRDEYLKEIQRMDILEDKIKGVFRFIEIMRVDSYNYHITRIKPFLQVHGYRYEKEKIKEIIDDKEFDLEDTKLWIRDYNLNLREFNLKKSLFNGFSSTLLRIKDKTFPQSFCLDKNELKELASIIKNIVCFNSILLFSKFKTENIDLIMNYCNDNFKLKHKDFLRSLYGFLRNYDLKDMDQSSFDYMTSSENPCTKLIFSKLKIRLEAYFFNQKSEIKLVDIGIRKFQKELLEAIAKSRQIAELNLHVFEEYYTSFLKQ